MPEEIEITGLLNRAAQGDQEAGERLWTVVYDALRRIARRELRGRGGGGPTLTTTGLVHEAYFKLADRPGIQWQDRNHFYALACRAMRQVLVDRARHRNAQKRGGGVRDVSLDRAQVATPARADELLELDDALTRLAQFNPRLAQLVECRFFGGLSTAETAEVLGLSLRTAEREWGRAKAYLYRLLRTSGEHQAAP